jgi:signal peptidase
MAVVALPRVGRDHGRPRLTQLRRLAGQLVWVLLSLLILSAAGLGIFIHTGHGAVTPVLTGSMRPGIQPGDAVVTRSVPVSSLHKGDIIVFRPPGQTLARVHRIYSIAPAKGGVDVVTKGDANNAPDPWGRILLKGHTLKLAFVIPKVGYVVNGGLRWLIAGLVFMFGAIIARMTWKYVRS